MGGVKEKLHRIEKEKGTFDSRSLVHAVISSFQPSLFLSLGSLACFRLRQLLASCLHVTSDYLIFSALEYNFNPYAFLC